MTIHQMYDFGERVVLEMLSTSVRRFAVGSTPKERTGRAFVRMGYSWFVATAPLRRIRWRWRAGPRPLLFLGQVPGLPTAGRGWDLSPGLRTRFQVRCQPPPRVQTP